MHPGFALSSEAETDGRPVLALRFCSNSDMLPSVEVEVYQNKIILGMRSFSDARERKKQQWGAGKDRGDSPKKVANQRIYIVQLKVVW